MRGNEKQEIAMSVSVGCTKLNLKMFAAQKIDYSQKKFSRRKV